MYPAYAKWVQSHRDLPVRLNQWCNVVVGARVLLVGLHFHVSIAFRACFLSFEREAVFKGFWTTKFVLIINHVVLLIKTSFFFFFFPILIGFVPAALGIQAPAAFPPHSGVPVAGGAQRLCHLRGGS